MSFRLKTILGIALIEAFLVLVLVGSNIYFLRSSIQDELLKRTHTTATLFAAATKDAVLSADLGSLEALVDEVMINPDVLYARVKGVDTVFAERGAEEVLAQPFQEDVCAASVNDHVFDVYADIREADTYVGRVELGFSIETLQSLLSKVRQQALGITLVAIVLTTLFSFMLGTVLTRQLKGMKEVVHQITEKNPGYQIDVQSKDDFADAADAVNLMSKSLDETIQQRDHLERELNEYKGLLEKRVEERTKKLVDSNQQLQQQIDEREKVEKELKRYTQLLEKSNEEIKSFSFIVSHDLRAPLANIKGFSGELNYSVKTLKKVLDKYQTVMEQSDQEFIQEILDEDIAEALKFVGASVIRMDNQINGIIKVSRMGGRKLHIEKVDIRALVTKIFSSLKHQIVEKSVTVELKNLPKVNADLVAMELIIGNLLDNALKYIPAGQTGLIEVCAVEQDDQITFHVKDNGCGIAEQDISKIFDIFNRAGSNNTSGDGMGLAYVKTLVTKLGGDIWCESQLGQGTTFSFTVPKKLASSDQHSR